MSSNMRTTSIPLTAENLPEGNLYEEDGSAWRAEKDHRGRAGVGFRSTGVRSRKASLPAK